MNEQNNFLDKKSLIAIGVAIMFWVFWSSYLAEKYPNANPQEVTQVEDEKKTLDSSNLQNKNQKDTKPTLSSPQTTFDKKASRVFKTKENLFSVSNDFFSLSISSRGMSLKNITLHQYSGRKGEPIKLGISNDQYGFLSTSVNSNPLNDFLITKHSNFHYTGIFRGKGFKVIKNYMFYEDTPFVEVTYQVQAGDDVPILLQNRVSDIESVEKTGNFLTKLAPQVASQELFTLSSQGKTRESIDSIESTQFSEVNILSFSKLYFVIALEDQSNIFPNLKLNKKNDAVLGDWSYQILQDKSSKLIKNRLYIGPTTFDSLKNSGTILPQVQDFGFFGFIGKYFLHILKFFFEIFGNWGLAIVALTLTVRLLLLPLNLKSMQSMQSMQKLQPQIKAAKEKYKDDTKKANQEVMEIMKQNKANPFGGCLFMLLQLPIFFALYQILAKSAYFYKEPFMFWIKDLTSPDPYFILPILMIITMLAQQKLSAKSMPKEQARMMFVVVLFFGFFMVSLPSGLCLYIWISTLFGFIQQVIVNKSLAKERS